MKNFAYARATDVTAAFHLASQSLNSHYIAGGTNLVDLMREGIEEPDTLIDISRLGYDHIEDRADGGSRIGALVTNSALAADVRIRELAGASAQLRNRASTGGNLLQRTRCYYFYDEAARCNKRLPGSGCDAVNGFNRIHAILGASSSCVATHPSDMCVALAALNAVVHVIGPNGERDIAFEDFHRLPGDTPERDTNLAPNELILWIDLPAPVPGLDSSYRKIRDRASYAFALVSVAAGLRVADGVIDDVRIALGGVAHRPWRARIAERLLKGKPVEEARLRDAINSELAHAEPLLHNAFKVDLASRVVVSSLLDLAHLKEVSHAAHD
jgi:xanthine dehydrogenase YagS FAD-binding subunit